MTLKEYILWMFKQWYSGKGRSIKRSALLELIQYKIDRNTADREMRQAYEGLAVCSSPKGLYLLKTEEERREQIALRMKLIYAHFRKIRVLREYRIELDSVQKNLF